MQTLRVRVVFRTVTTVAGAFVAAVVVAIVEASAVLRALVSGGEAAPSWLALVLADIGLLFPVAFAAGAAIVPLAFVIEPEGSTTLGEDLARIRARGASRLRAAAVAPLVFVALFVFTVGAAHAGRSFSGAGRPSESGLSMGIAVVVLALSLIAAGLAILPSLWRWIAQRRDARVGDPLVTGAAALGVTLLLMLAGILTGDPGGGGGGVPGVGLFGVLSRPELDLRPVVYTALMAAGAYAGSSFGRKPYARNLAIGGAVVVVGVFGMCLRASSALGAEPLVVSGVEHHAPLARASLAGLRRLTDRDKDGYSASFGGPDCNDRDPKINPNATDVPGNGVDEDCSGEDTPAYVATPEPTPEPAANTAPDAAPAAPKRTYNVIFFTVDTLRADLGFAGYPKPVSPNLDALAAKAQVFERAYSLSSYTAKSMGPMMIGRYPSETKRDYEHFTTYYATNTFVAERVKAAGQHTFAGHCHYYFSWNTGYSRGFATYDSSAIPPGMGDNDSSITSDRLADLAIKMLSKAENNTPPDGKRFFSWFHFFDPHAQYVKHAGAPAFDKMEGGPPGRSVYDEEVWYTDKHIGRVIDYVQSQPWGKDTAIILTADHGEAFGDAHGVKTHGHELWEPLVRVPLIVYIPDEEPRRIKIKRSAIDIAPTIMDLVGAPPAAPGELRGRSLLHDVHAPPTAQLEERDIYLDMPEGPYNDTRRAIITGATPGTKLLHFGGRRYQVFDLAKDPAENNDLANDESVLKPMLDRLSQARARMQEITVSRRGER